MARTEELVGLENSNRGAPKRLRAAFINTGVANCSIHESGLMVHDCICRSRDYDMDYFALSDINVAEFAQSGVIRRHGDARPTALTKDYDFWVFNWHFITMAMLLAPDAIKALPGLKFTVVLELSPGDPLKLVPAGVFDGFIALDPAAEERDGIYPFPRPLQGKPRRPEPTRRDVPVIGSFGYGTPGKGFEQLVQAVSDEFDRAIVRINVPTGTYIGTDVVHRSSYVQHLEAVCNRIAKPGIEVRFSQRFMEAEELIGWCGENDLNCFMYTRCQPGLSATTDQAIQSGRPLATLTNDTFRHIHRYVPPYPVISLKEAMANSAPWVRRMQEDWSSEAFNAAFQRMLAKYGFKVARDGDAGAVKNELQPFRGHILAVHKGKPSGGGKLDYCARLADCLGRTGEFVVVRATCDQTASAIERIRQVGPAAVVATGFSAAELAQLDAEVRATPGVALIAIRNANESAELVPSPATRTIAWRPIVPFFTVQVARAEPDVVSLVGFSHSASSLEATVQKLLNEQTETLIEIEAPNSDDAGFVQRIEVMRRHHGEAGKRIFIKELPQDGEALVNSLAASSLIVISHDPARAPDLEAIACLAMTTERAVVFTRSMPPPAFGSLVTYFEDASVAESISLGLAAQIRIRHAFGEWNLFADVRHAILDVNNGDIPVTRIHPPFSAPGATAVAAPSGTTLDEILALDQDRFVQAVYEALLRRPPDPDGLRHHIDLLNNGVTKRAIIASVRLSPEGRARNVDIDGLSELLRKQKMFRTRVRGKLRRLLVGKRGGNSPARAVPESRVESPTRPPEVPGAEALQSQPAPQSPLATQPAIGFASRAVCDVPFSGDDHIFIVAGIDGRATELGAYSKSLVNALRSLKPSLHVVTWVPEGNRFRLAHVSDFVDGELDWTLSAPGSGAALVQKGFELRGWVLLPGRDYADPAESELLEMNIVLEARRLGLRSAFVFHGAGPLGKPQAIGAAAASHELYMQALLLADAIVPVSAAAEDDLNDFFVQHQFADFVPPIQRLPFHPAATTDGQAEWIEYGRRLMRLLAQVSDPSRHIKRVSIWTGLRAAGDMEEGFSKSLITSLRARGVGVSEVNWDSASRTIVGAHATSSDERVHFEPGEWIIAPGGIPADILSEIQANSQGADIRIATIVRDAKRGGETRSLELECAALSDKAFFSSRATERAFYRYMLRARTKAPCAGHRYQVLKEPAETTDAPRRLRSRDAPCDGLRCVAFLTDAATQERLVKAAAEAGESLEEQLTLSIIMPEVRVGGLQPAPRKSDILSVEWVADAEPTAWKRRVDEADFVLMVGAAEHYQVVVDHCLRQAIPCVVDAQNDLSVQPGVDKVRMERDEQLVEALQRSGDRSWLSCLSQEAATQKDIAWDDYTRELLVAMAQDRFRDHLERPKTADRGDIYSRLVNLSRRPKLSICISTYKRAGWVAVNLRNLFSQIPVPRNDIEILVVDNTSPDNTPEVVKPYLDRPDFRYIRNPKNVGMLGNLAITAQRARGEHIWIIGDDDLTRRGLIDKIMSILNERPNLPLIYMNYGYTSEEFPDAISDLDAYTDGYNVLEPTGPDVMSTVHGIAAKCENFYTAIYSHIYRRDHGLRAYCQETSGRIFATMVACIPTAYYVLHYMPDLPAYWIGEPSLVVNSRVSWAAYGPMLDLEHLPATWDLAERAGCPSVEVDRRRSNRLWLVKMMWRDLFENDIVGNADYIDPPTVLLRLNYLPEMKDHIGELIEVYERAHAAGHRAARMPPSVLFAAWR